MAADFFGSWERHTLEDLTTNEGKMDTFNDIVKKFIEDASAAMPEERCR